MAPVPIMQTTRTWKSRRTAEVIGADRILPATRRAQLYQRRSAANSMEPTRGVAVEWWP